MSCLLRQPRAFCSALLGLAAVLGGGACAGTPLPEPPDALPRPRFEQLAAEDAVGPVVAPASTAVRVSMAAASIPPGARLSVVNLDRPDVPVVTATGPDAGQRYVANLGASPGDRLRLLFTSGRVHSPPLDLVVVVSDAALAFSLMALGDTSLPCLQVTPNESVVLSGRRGQLFVTNACDVPVELTRAALRTGAEGIQLGALPVSQLAPGAQIALTLEDTQAPGPSERLDVLLIDVSAQDGRQGRYAIDVFSDLE
jgi:hypothetical protein